MLPLLPPSGSDLCFGHAGVEKQPIRGLGGLCKRCMLFLFYLMQAAEILDIDCVTMADKWDQI